MSSEAAPPSPVPARVLYASYGMGLGSITISNVFNLIVPLYALSIGAGPSEIGLLVGAWAAGPALFALHGGSLVDRFGARRVMLGGTVLTTVLAILVPTVPQFWILVPLQFCSGLLTTLSWLASQAQVAQQCRGDAAILGQYNFTIRIGTILAPPAAGALWDAAGAWPTFCALASMGVALHILVRVVADPNVDVATRPWPSLMTVLPRISDYTRALKLMLLPIIAFTIVVSTLRNGTSGLQTSIYLVYLHDIGYQGTVIGILFGAAEVAVALASLFVGTVKRLGPTEWVLLGTAVVATVAISATPFLNGNFVLLMLMMILIGAAQGFMQPIIFSIQSMESGKDFQGAVVGLRLTTNRITNTIIPPIAGTVAEFAGVEMGFVLVGAAFLIGCAVTGYVIATRPAFRLTR